MKHKIIYDYNPSISTTYNKSVPDPNKEQITGEALYYLSKFIETSLSEKELKEANDKIRFIN